MNERESEMDELHLQFKVRHAAKPKVLFSRNVIPFKGITLFIITLVFFALCQPSDGFLLGRLEQGKAPVETGSWEEMNSLQRSVSQSSVTQKLHSAL